VAAPGPELLTLGFQPAGATWPVELGQLELVPGDTDGQQVAIRAAAPGPKEDRGSLWLEAQLPASAWSDAGDRYWKAAAPLMNEAWGFGAEQPRRLLGAAMAYTAYQPKDGATPEPPDNSFGCFQGQIYLRLPAGERPAEGLRFGALVPRGQEQPSGLWHVELGRFCGAGWPLLSGLPAEQEINLDGSRELWFQSAAIALQGGYPLSKPDPALHGRSRGDGISRGEVRFRVWLGERMLAEFTQAVTTEGNCIARRVSLPQEPGQRAKLKIEVEGLAICAAFGPRLVQSKPKRSEQPNLLIALLDTFRADNLSAYGSTAAVTPNLDAWAQRGLVLTHTWSSGGWTLPSQATLMTSLWPLQHGALNADQAIPASAVTLAEELAAAGYRTGAITDGGLISRRHDFEQGFEWFEERFRPLEDLLAAAQEFLEADDGRPTFLYLHTYRAHHPYYAAAETLATHGARLGALNSYDEGLAAIEAHPQKWWNHKGPLPEDLRGTLRGLHGLSRAGVLDLDRQLGDFLAGWQRTGWFDPGYLLVTSDHGEAFGEHDNFRHEGGAYEEQARIPLFLVGPGIAPRLDPRPASLIDVAPSSLAALGLPVPASWRGQVLLQPGPERSLLCVAGGPQANRPIAVMRGSDKLLMPELDLRAESVWGAFDLAQDPAERHNRLPAEASEVRGLFGLLEPDLRGFARDPLPTEAARGGGTEQALHALGYLDTQH
jgi:arylsulfatase